MRARSIVRRAVPDNQSLPDSIHPVLRRIYAARNIAGMEELDYSLEGLCSYHALGGIDAAVKLLADALEQERRILIVADFDADGATGCALAIRGLRQMGARDVRYIVPSRFDYGYGLTPGIVEVAAADKPDLLITVDNGISSIDGVELARSYGIDVLVTDHHLPGAALPRANAIVNPNLPGDAFPSKSLAGVGVVFYLLAALRTHLRDSGWFERHGLADPRLVDLLDLVALGTVADVVPLDRNNRILVEQGLKRVRAGRCIPGIRALLLVAGRRYQQALASDFGFAVGPRLNAAGRLTDMTLGIECLLCDDEEQAMEMAASLDKLNKERREIQQHMQDSAAADLPELGGADMPFGLCLFNADWHQGVVGVLASRLKDEWHRPVIAFARDRDGQLKGSGRSIAAIHLRDLLDSIATGSPGLIRKFGGHAMAAGLAIDERDFDAFRRCFETACQARLSVDDLTGVIHSDGELQATDLNLTLAASIQEGGPWGNGFPEPVFDGVFQLTERRIVGERHLKMSLALPGSPRRIDAIAFYTLDEDWPADVNHVHLAYRLDINEYNGRRSEQLIAEFVEPIVL